MRAAHNLELVELQTKDATSMFLEKGGKVNPKAKKDTFESMTKLTTSVFRQSVLEAALGSRAATKSHTLILPS